jgi:hypothetical protein
VTDDELLAGLRAAASEADPVPEHVLAAARAAHVWAAVEGELLELRFDSLLDSGQTATRSGGGGRVLRFAAPGATAELHVAGTGAVAVVGQLDPAAAGEVELRHAGGAARAPVDDLGRFTLDGIPPGPATLRWEAPDGRPVRTAWIVI